VGDRDNIASIFSGIIDEICDKPPVSDPGECMEVEANIIIQTPNVAIQSGEVVISS
jgi:hypothetical protein